MGALRHAFLFFCVAHTVLPFPWRKVDIMHGTFFFYLPSSSSPAAESSELEGGVIGAG